MCHTGKAVVYLVVDSAKCDAAPATVGWANKVCIKNWL